MSMGGGGSIRTIWITLRAVNYASLVIGDIQKDVGNLIKKEFMLSKTNQELITSTKNYLQAGMMFATLAQQMAGSILNMAMNSREGAGDMARLKQQIFLTTNALNNAAYEFLKSSGALALLSNILKELQKNKGLQQVVILMLAVAAGLAAIAAVGMLAGAAINGFWAIIGLGVGPLLQLFNLLGLTVLRIRTMYIETGLAVGAFMVFYTLASALSGPLKAIVGLIMLVVGALMLWAFWGSLASGGLTVGAGLAAIGGGMAAAGGLTLANGAVSGFASGTQSVQRTGPVFAHKGEVIYNPATNRPSQVGNDMGRGGNTTNMNTQITIENVHTKADYDDVAYQINKANRMGARSVR